MAARSSGRGEKGGKSADKGESVDKGEKCLTCGVTVKDQDLGLQCEVCEGWWHAKCEGIGEEGYKVLQMENTHWYCIGCNKGIGKIIAAVNKVQKKQERCDKEVKEMRDSQEGLIQWQTTAESVIDKLKGELESHTHEIVEIREAIKEFNNSLQQQQQDSQKQLESDDSLWSTVVNRHVEKKIENVKEEIHEAQRTVLEAKMHIDEEKEKDKRKKNIIIYRMPESTAAGFDGRRKDDLEFCQHLVQDALGIEGDGEMIQNVIRLGKKEQSRVRPLLVMFKEVGIKNEVMESLGKLAEADEKFRSLSVSHDLTQKEREECKEMVAEAKDRQQQDTSGEWVYRVRGSPGNMKIVRLKKRLQVTGDGSTA